MVGHFYQKFLVSPSPIKLVRPTQGDLARGTWAHTLLIHYFLTQGSFARRLTDIRIKGCTIGGEGVGPEAGP